MLRHSQADPSSKVHHSLLGRVLLILLLGGAALGTQANVLSIAVSGSGQVAGGNSFCTSSGEASCDVYYGTADTTITLTATPGAGQVFDGWGGECLSSGTSPQCSILVLGSDDSILISQNVSASFSLPTFPLTVVPGGSGKGTVTSDSSHPGINCPGDCSELYTGGSTVVLTAIADIATGSTFTGWQGGGCSGTGTCTVTMDSAQTVAAMFEGDADRDSVSDPLDLCPNTPAGETVDANGCSASQLDDDNDDVSNAVDQCPNTPPREAVDAIGCSSSQLDDDNDGVSNAVDQCPNTPAGEVVNAVGCSPSQLDGDDDEDGVRNSVDQCPNTPAGEVVNAVGCSPSQLDGDDDEDGVRNSVDQCPNTPAGEAVNAVGCSPSQLDGDGDGIADDIDQCPDTDADADVNKDGCADNQVDSDSDGVFDDQDQCPNTSPEVPTDAQGCSEVQRFGNDLGSLPGLSINEQLLGARIDEICPRLVESGSAGKLTKGQRDLRNACSRLKDRGTSEDQAVTALREISLRELASQKDYAVEIATTHYRHLGSRIDRMKAGGGSGVSVSDLNIGMGDRVLPGQVLQSALDGLLGMGASGDTVSDFGKLGLFIQGDLDFGDRDDTALESGYEFDAWNLAAGVDYRFTDELFAGLSISLGEVEVDYDGSGGSSDISNWTLSAYGGWQLSEQWFIDGLLSYGDSDFDTKRKLSYVDVGGAFDSVQRGNTDGQQIFVGLNTGYMINKGAWRFGPTASLAYLDGSIDAFTETAVGSSSEAWNFAVDEQNYKSLRISLGAQADYIFITSFGVVVPGIRAAWVSEQEDGADRIAMRLVNNPFAEDDLSSKQIRITTDGRDSDFLDVSLNLSGQFVMGFSGFVSYQFYSSYDNYSQDGFSLGMRWDKPF